MKVHLHIGAHKTATTFLQARLTKCLSLEEHRIAVAPHARVRSEISDRLDIAASIPRFFKPSIKAGIAKLVADHAGAGLMIVSDENLAGPMASVESKQGLYPDIGARLAALLPQLRGCDVWVFVSVRDYAAFFSSVYAFRAGQSKAAPLDVYQARAAGLERGWAEVLADVAGEVGASRVVVWSYERFLEAPDEISVALTGGLQVEMFPASAKPLLTSLTEKGLTVLERVSDLLGEAERTRFARHLARFAFDPPDSKISVLDGALAARLSERYRADLAAIEALGCRVLGRSA